MRPFEKTNLGVKEQVHVYPKSCQEFVYEQKDIHYLFLADVDAGIVAGYTLAFSAPSLLKATKVWNIILQKDTQKIVHAVMKRPFEHVHSQGRVMGDRSVLYKYLNPNLAVIITEGSDVTQKSFLNVYLTDTVTGLIVYFVTHKRATGPVHVVHSENWAVYSYYNEKLRRIEMSAIELYEGKTQSNTTAFSSLTPPPLPIIEHQTFIFPSVIEAMADTVTERGMTSKHLLIALPSGGIVELPKAFLDPRRPVHPTAEHREEGLIPYIPELPIPAEGIINYNQSVSQVRGIQTAPSGLESTCLVFAYGLGCWKRMKIDAKKAVDANRHAINATGGGSPSQALTPRTLTVVEVLGDSINPLENPNDPRSPMPLTCAISNESFDDISPQNIQEPAEEDYGEIPAAEIEENQTQQHQEAQRQASEPTPKSRKRPRDEERELTLEILKESLATEKYCHENERLLKWMLIKECESKGYDLLPDHFN